MSSEPSSRDAARAPGKVVQVGKYTVVAHIATGGMGAVYRATDTETGREVALKVLNPKMAARADALQRFHREAHNAAQLRHENIVTVYEVGEHKGVVYLAMEFIDGIDLHDHITQAGRLEVEEARDITLQAARALQHAHKRGVIHRDIKPSNFLLMRQDGRLVVKLTDLGLSRQANDDEFRVTREGFTVGTIDYISPEQARDSASADIRSDIYSLGCSLYHMLTGQTPFPEGGLAERIYKHMEVEPADVREVRPDVPASLWFILKKMLAKKPADRFQTPKELIQALSHMDDPGLAPLDEPEVKAPRIEEREIKGPRMKRPETLSSAIDALTSSPPVPAPRVKEAPAPVRADKKKAEAPRPRRKQKQKSSRNWLLIGAAGGVLLAVIALVVVLRLGGDQKTDDTPDDGRRDPDTPIKKPDPIVEKKDPVKPPADTAWPPLRADGATLDRQPLARTFEAGWEQAPLPADVPVFRVRRQPGGGGQYSSVGEAARAAQEKGGVGIPGMKRACDAIIEIHDNGPLYESATAFTGKSILIRAAPGYRPLICWDLERESLKPLPPLLSLQGGSLTLEGIEVVLAGSRPASDGKIGFVRVTGGDFVARACTFSVAGSHPAGVFLARLEGNGPPGSTLRCRLSRCQVRGPLTALDVDMGTRDLLLDDSLLVGASGPLLDLHVKKGDRGRVLLLRSTLIGRGTCLRVTGDAVALPADTLRLLAWDALLARTGPGRTGVLLELPAAARPEAIHWQGANCLFAGWASLLRGPKEIEGSDTPAWERHWTSPALERADLSAWPAAGFSEPGAVSALEYSTRKTPGAPVGYASTSWPCLASSPAGPAPPALGCPVELLPPARDLWQQWTVQRFVTPRVEMLTRSTPPEIPAGGPVYQGGRIDLAQEDLGALLGREQVRGLAPRVVLHLFRSGTGRAKPSSPIRVKNTDLVLFFERTPRPGASKEKPETDRLVLDVDGNSPRTPPAFIEIENGNLDLIGGEIRCPDFRQAQLPAYVLKISGGVLRLHNMNLVGPLTDPPDGFDGLVHVLAADKATALAVNDTVLQSPRNGLRVQGSGARVRMVQSVLVAGTVAIDLVPAETKGKDDLSCTLDNVTVAAGRAVARLGSAAGASADEPVVVQTRACALLNPFGTKAGILLYEGDALERGVMLWQGEGDVYDKRLHFGAATAGSIPEQAQTFAGWLSLWGPGVSQHAQGNFPQGPRFDKDRWALDRLLLTPTGPGSSKLDARGIGADLQRLGLLGKTRPR